MGNSADDNSRGPLQYFPLNSFVFSNYRNLLASVAVGGASLLLLRRWFAGGRLRSDARLDGKVAIVTGGNCGIGLETAVTLASRGASVVLACRDSARAAAAVSRVQEASGSRLVTAESLDLASLQSVRDFAKRFEAEHDRLDLLVNNAGVMACPESRTEDGFETQLGVNHLGHFLLTCLLLPLLKRTRQARIVNVSSLAHRNGKIHWENLNLVGQYSPFKAYAQSKLANILFTNALAEKLQGHDVTAYSLHPGVVKTNLMRHQNPLLTGVTRLVSWLMFKSSEEGAQTTLHCALAPLSELKNGGYYSDCQLTTPRPQARSMEDSRRLWEMSERLVGLKE